MIINNCLLLQNIKSCSGLLVRFMTLRRQWLETSTQRNARKRVSKDRGGISQRGDEVRERFRSKSDCTGTPGEGGGGERGVGKKEEVDLHKRSWLGRASRVSPRGEPERRKLPGTAWICPIGSLLARLFHGPGIVVTNVQTITATITPPTSPPLPTSHNEPLFASSLGVRVVCSTRDICSALAVFSIFVIILFLLSYLPVCGARRQNILLKTSWK